MTTIKELKKDLEELRNPLSMLGRRDHEEIMQDVEDEINRDHAYGQYLGA